MAVINYSGHNISFTKEHVETIKELTCRGINYYMIINKRTNECIGICTDHEETHDRCVKLNKESNSQDYIYDFIKNT